MRERLARRPEAIRAMFAGVARRYDLLNRLLSLRRDVAWRRVLVAAAAAAPPGRVLDCATGTGDVVLAMAGDGHVGADFCLDMLALARRKSISRGRRVAWVAADALALPFRDGAFAAVTVAFGIRNFADLPRGLAELRRVLGPGGVVAILEFQRPPHPAVRLFSRLWGRLVVTPLGRALSDDGAAYAYLPASVEDFPDGRRLAAVLAEQGLEVIQSRQVSWGIAAVTVARRREVV